MAEKSKELSLAEKLNKAIADIGPVQKDGSNSFQNYRFQSEAAIKSAVKKAISANGFDIIPSYEILGQRDVQGRKGTINHIVDVMGTFTITDGRKDQEMVGQMPGTGMDTGEKATAKACTSAQKYFYKQLFNISDQEEDPDATDSNIGATSTQQQRQPRQQGNYQRRQQNTPRRQQSTSNRQQSASDPISLQKQQYEQTINKIVAATGQSRHDIETGLGKTLKADSEYQAANNLGKWQKTNNVANEMLKRSIEENQQ